MGQSCDPLNDFKGHLSMLFVGGVLLSGPRAGFYLIATSLMSWYDDGPPVASI